MFTVADLDVAAGGRLGIAPLPGAFGTLTSDLDVIAAWRPDIVVSMTEQSEMDAAKVGDLGERIVATGLAWHHLPVRDFGAPDETLTAAWRDVLGELHRCLDGKGGVLLHCRGGRGRSGMLALRLLIGRGEAPDAALKRLRAVRPGAVETQDQLAWANAGVPVFRR